MWAIAPLNQNTVHNNGLRIFLTCKPELFRACLFTALAECVFNLSGLSLHVQFYTMGLSNTSLPQLLAVIDPDACQKMVAEAEYFGRLKKVKARLVGTYDFKGEFSLPSSCCAWRCKCRFRQTTHVDRSKLYREAADLV